jgi:hypothetical protein
VPATAFGVRALLGHENETSLVRVVGIRSFTARGKAAATLQRVLQGNAIFWMCANDPDHAPNPPMLVADASLTPPWDVNDAAIGLQYQLYGNDTKLTDCATPSGAIRGLVDTDSGPYALPGWWNTKTGNVTGPTIQGIDDGSLCNAGAGAVADGVADPCIVVVPLCVGSNGESGSNAQFDCQRLATFRVQVAENHDIEGVFLGAGSFVEGPGGGAPQPGEARTIKLVE